LPKALQCVREQPVPIPQEGGEISIRIGEYLMDMIRKNLNRMELHVVLVGQEGRHVPEEVLKLAIGIGPKQVVALRYPCGSEPNLAGLDIAGSRHGNRQCSARATIDTMIYRDETGSPSGQAGQPLALATSRASFKNGEFLNDGRSLVSMRLGFFAEFRGLWPRPSQCASPANRVASGRA
jgi:hypothetical protein